MPAREIHIDRIQLELSGVSAAVASDALGSLGPALDAALARSLAQRSSPAPALAGLASSIASSTGRITSGDDAASVRNCLATGIAAAIATRIAASPTPPTST